MKRILIALFAMAVFAIIGCSLVACTAKDDGRNTAQLLSFSLKSDGTYQVDGIGACKDAQLEIPAKYRNKAVTSIKPFAFSDCTGLTSVKIPDSVTRVGFGAFSGCTSLKSITIPFVGWMKDGTSDSHFGYIFGARYNSENSKYVPSALEIVNITGGTIIEGSAFSACLNLTSVIISDKVTSIGFSAFNGCRGLTSMVVPFVGASPSANSNTHFGYIFGASSYSYNSSYVPSSLKNVVITGGTSIGENAFSNCNGQTSITIPSSIMSIGDYAFVGCTSLTSIYYEGDVASWCEISGLDNLMGINRTLYIKGEKLEGKLVIPSSVTMIPNSAFSGCRGLTSIHVPDCVTHIGNYAFYGCSNLRSIMIQNGVISIGDYAFNSCRSLSSISIPNSVMHIGVAAFSNCPSLAYNEHNNAHYLGNEETPYLVLIKVLDNTIVEYEIDSSAQIIYDSAFSNCAKLITITIPSDATDIGSSAFYGCNSLTSIIIPNSVKTIGSKALYGCCILDFIRYQGQIEQWNEIRKGNQWNYDTGDYTIYCAGRSVKKS